MTQELRPTDVSAQIDRAFDDLPTGLLEAFRGWPFGPWESPPGSSPPGFRPARTDVTDTGAAYRIVAEVPGIPKEKVEVKVRGASVEIRGEYASSTETSRGDFVHRERRSAGYYRALELPEPVVAQKAKAKVENGLLELELPKLNPGPTAEEFRVSVE